MTDTYDFFDTANVSPQIKRLGACFKMAAENGGEDRGIDEVVSEGVSLFRSTTGIQGSIETNKDEAAYLRWQFLETASKMCVGKLIGWQSVSGEAPAKAKKIEAAAVNEGIKL